MSSSPDFKTALVESSVISDITNQEVFGVLAGPALSTYTQLLSKSLLKVLIPKGRFFKMIYFVNT